LEGHNLIKKLFPGNYNSFYELSKELKVHVKDETAPKLTNCDVHHIRRKYRILHVSLPVSKDKRAGYLKSWGMRGGDRYKHWYPGKAGEPSVTVDVHPHTIIVYPDARQKVLAGSIQEAEDKMNMACHNAVQKFLRIQAKFGIHIEVDEIGQQITPTHYAFPLSKSSPFANAGSLAPETWTDGSPEKHGEPDRLEYEMTDRGKATALDQAIDKVMSVDALVKDSVREAMPEAMKEFEKSFGPLTSEIQTVMAHLQSGQSVQNQINQLVFIVGKLLEGQHKIEEKIERRNYPTAYTPTYEE